MDAGGVRAAVLGAITTYARAMRTRRLGLILTLAAAVALGAAACSSSDEKSSAAPAAEEPQFYVSLGDSYASGYQPPHDGDPGGNNTNGFAYQLVGKLKAKGIDVTLKNFGCGGATTVSILQTNGCNPKALGPEGVVYTDVPQAAAAETFIKENPGRIALITVSIGGNDITSCAAAADPVPCVGAAVGNVKTNVSQLAQQLRAAAGPNVPIVGITYPNVILGEWVPAPEASSNQAANQGLATLSVTAFEQFINPALKEAYESAGGKFVDVTTATGGFTPLTETTDYPPYGSVPVAVAKVCGYSFFCNLRDIHATTEGYGVIADLIAADMPKQ